MDTLKDLQERATAKLNEYKVAHSGQTLSQISKATGITTKLLDKIALGTCTDEALLQRVIIHLGTSA